MSEKILIALISFIGAILGALIGAIATIIAAVFQSGSRLGQGNVSCGMIGGIALITMLGGLFIGGMVGASLFRTDNAQVNIPTVASPSTPPVTIATPSQIPLTEAPLHAISANNVDYLVEQRAFTYESYHSSAIAWSSEILAIAVRDRIYLYDATTFQPIRNIINGAAMLDISFAPDGKTLASAGFDGLVRLWRVDDANLLLTLRNHVERVTSVAFSHDGRTLAAGNADETLKLWEVPEGNLLRSFERIGGGITSIDFAPTGESFVAGSEDGKVRIWRTGDGQLLHVFDGSDPVSDWEGDEFYSIVLDVSFSPEGDKVITGGIDGTVRLYNVDSGAYLGTLQAPPRHRSSEKDCASPPYVFSTTSIVSVAFAPDGQIVASGRADGRISLWRVIDNGFLGSLDIGCPIDALAFARNGQQIAFSSMGDATFVWGVP